jgi:hypothetical protein
MGVIVSGVSARGLPGLSGSPPVEEIHLPHTVAIAT